jgi:valyl-tRNA synthetase
MFQRADLFTDTPNATLLNDFEAVKEVTGSTRAIRLQKKISPKEPLSLEIVGENKLKAFDAVIAKMGNISDINIVTEKTPAAVSFMSGTTEYAVVLPLGSLMDVEAERKKLTDELTYVEGFLQSVMKKLSNEKFVAHAPEAVVATERKKQADAESKIASLKAAIEALN